MTTNGAAASDAPRRDSPRRRRSVIGRTLADLSHAVEHALFAEETARRAGLLQAFDPRVKVLATLALLIAVALSHSLAVIAGLYAVTLALAWASAIPLTFFVKRVWLFLPFFTGVLVLPALFITPGPPLAQLPLGFAVTRTGATVALFLLLRVSTSVSMGALLIFTTPWNDVLKALGVLGVPDAFILILGMTYRYIHLLLRTANDMFLSRKSRVIRHSGGAWERRMIGASAGVLLGKSLHLSSEVYLVMQSRGYRGYAHVPGAAGFAMRRRDWAALSAAALITGISIVLGR